MGLVCTSCTREKDRDDKYYQENNKNYYISKYIEENRQILENNNNDCNRDSIEIEKNQVNLKNYANNYQNTKDQLQLFDEGKSQKAQYKQWKKIYKDLDANKRQPVSYNLNNYNPLNNNEDQIQRTKVNMEAIIDLTPNYTLNINKCTIDSAIDQGTRSTQLNQSKYQDRLKKINESQEINLFTLYPCSNIFFNEAALVIQTWWQQKKIRQRSRQQSKYQSVKSYFSKINTQDIDSNVEISIISNKNRFRIETESEINTSYKN